MTTAATTGPDVLGSVPLDPAARTRLRSLKRPAAVLALVLLVAVAVGLGRSGPAGYLDPDAATPAGGHALRVLLQEQGVTVVPVTTAEAAVSQSGPGDTVLVVSPNDLSEDQVSALQAVTADIVFVDPTVPILSRLVPWLTVKGEEPAQPRDAACDLPAALRAGRAVTGGLTVDGTVPSPDTLTLCYAAGGAATVAQTRLGSGRVITVLGSGEGLTNDQLATEGDAALALDLLGAHPRLVWYVGAPTVPVPQGSTPLGDLLPGWVRLAVLQLCVGVGLLALWQGRRFGPVVEEPLPVVVRAAEATEGRARLYRRARARDRAAQNLRTAALSRLVPLVGQSRTADATAITAAAAARSGWSAVDVGALLYGAAPVDDAALVRLATQIDALERMVRHP